MMKWFAVFLMLALAFGLAPLQVGAYDGPPLENCVSPNLACSSVHAWPRPGEWSVCMTWTGRRIGTNNQTRFWTTAFHCPSPNNNPLQDCPEKFLSTPWIYDATRPTSADWELDQAMCLPNQGCNSDVTVTDNNPWVVEGNNGCWAFQ